ncbi:hypothetical protein BH11ACT1_BH11ACT1_14070 [soil metagenome]
MIAAFPRAGRRVEHAYTELDLAGNGTPQQRNALGDARLLARPWDPASCVDPQLRAEVWRWLDEVVTWLNHEYAWDAEAMVPSCWPKHPHLGHEIAVLADLRRRAGVALTGDALEEWHRYALPAFTDRMRGRLGQHCGDGSHQPWPAQGRHTRHEGDAARSNRTTAFRADCDFLSTALGTPDAVGIAAPRRPNLQVVDGLRVDLDSGELLD